MYIDGYSAWITVPGPEHELREFDVAVDEYNRKSTCWIPSIEGMRFSVHWMDHGHRIATATFIKLDGYTVPGHFLMGSGEAERSDIRVGITTVRPFQFQKVPEVYIGAIPKDTDPTELGTIIVKIKRVSIVGKQGKNAPLVPRPPIGGKRSIGAEDPVGIGYGNEEMGHVQMPMTWKVRPWDRSNPGTYATFIFRYRTRQFLISQGIMSESDVIYTNVHARQESPYFSTECDDDSEEDDAESVPPSPTEPSPPSTPALSVRSGLSPPGRVPSVRPPSRPVSSRSFSLGEPPRPTSTFPQAPPSWNPTTPAPLPHPIVPNYGPPHPQDTAPSPRPNVVTRRVVSYDATTTRAVSAAYSPPESVPSTTPPAQDLGATRTTTIHRSGAVSYYNLSATGSQHSVASSYDLGATETYDFSTLGAFNVGAAGHFNISSAEEYDVNAAYAHGEEPNPYHYDEDPNVYLSYPYVNTGSYDSANNSYDSSADNSYDHGVTGPYDPSSVIHSYDPDTLNIANHYGHAPTTYQPQEQAAEEHHVEGAGSILARAAEAVKTMPSGYEGPPVETAPPPRPPKEKRPYSKTRPGPSKYLGQGPYKDLAPKTAPSQSSPEATEGGRSVSTTSSQGSSASSPQGPPTRMHAAAKAQTEAQKAQEEAVRAEKARQRAARYCTPAVPIPEHLVFVDADGGELPPPSPTPIIPTTRNTSGSSRRR